MSVKEAVFNFIEKNPEMSLDQIVTGLPDLNKASVRKYYYDYRKREQNPTVGKPAAKKSGKQSASLRRKVYDLLNGDPTISIDKICQAIEGSNRKTIRDYRNRWRKENPELKSAEPTKLTKRTKNKDDDRREALFIFMRSNPDANLNDLRNRFPENKKLVTDFRAWKHQEANNRKVADGNDTMHLSVDSYKKTIQSLKQVIEKQKATIESQRLKLKQIRTQLAQTPKFNLNGLKSFLSNKIFNK